MQAELPALEYRQVRTRGSRPAGLKPCSALLRHRAHGVYLHSIRFLHVLLSAVGGLAVGPGVSAGGRHCSSGSEQVWKTWVRGAKKGGRACVQRGI